jgi:hypothetical protein
LKDFKVKVGSIWFSVRLMKKMDGDRWALYFHEHFVRWLSVVEVAIMEATYSQGRESMIA